MDAVGVAIGEKDMVLVSGDCVNGEVRVRSVCEEIDILRSLY